MDTTAENTGIHVVPTEAAPAPAPAPAPAAAAPVEPAKPVTEVERLTALVDANNRDFDNWNTLLSAAEKEGDGHRLGGLYERFLTEFPLCFGYWKKYAELKMKLNEEGNGVNDGVAIYERGVLAVPHSIEIWVAYISFISDKVADISAVRRVYERAAAIVGSDWNSHTFWDKFIDFEISQEAFTHVTYIYGVILSTPINMLDSYWEKFKQFVNAKAYTQVMSTQEAEAIAAKFSTEGKSEVTDADYKQAYISGIEPHYLASTEKAGKRRSFESGVKRSFFHNRPLDEAQLSNWRAYLDFETKEGTYQTAKKLFERCLVACCNYAEYWVRYAGYAEENNEVDLAITILRNGATVYNKVRPELHLELAELLEQQGQIEEATKAFDNLLSQFASSHIESVVRAAAFFSRHSKGEKAVEILKKLHETADLKYQAYLSLQLANYLAKNGDIEGGRALFVDSIDNSGDSKAFWIGYVNYEIAYGGSEAISRASALYARALADESKLSNQDKQDLAIHQVDLFYDKNADVEIIRKAKSQLRQVQRTRVQESRKRTADDATHTPHKYSRIAAPQPAVPVTPTAVPVTPTAVLTPAAPSWGGYNAATSPYTYGYNYGAQSAAGVPAATATGQYPYSASYNYGSYGGAQ